MRNYYKVSKFFFFNLLLTFASLVFVYNVIIFEFTYWFGNIISKNDSLILKVRYISPCRDVIRLNYMRHSTKF